MTTFMFDVEVQGLTNARGQAAAEECADRNAWPITFVPGREEKRWFGIKKSYPAVLELATDSGGSPLSPTVERDADTIDMYAGAAERIATTVRVISDHFPEGFVFRATWAGSPIQRDETLSIDDLSELIRDSGLNEFTRYTVPPLTEIGGGLAAPAESLPLRLAAAGLSGRVARGPGAAKAGRKLSRRPWRQWDLAGASPAGRPTFSSGLPL